MEKDAYLATGVKAVLIEWTQLPAEWELGEGGALAVKVKRQKKIWSWLKLLQAAFEYVARGG